MVDQELAHSGRGEHPFTDDMMLMIYRHVLLHAIRNPFQLIFNTKEWVSMQTKIGPTLTVLYIMHVFSIGLVGVENRQRWNHDPIERKSRQMNASDSV